jgi:WD40 repeat protein
LEETAMSAIRRVMLVSGLLVPALGGGVSAAEKGLSGDALPPGAVARLGTARLRDSSVLQAIAYSPDGKTLIAASKAIRMWDAADGRLTRELRKDPHYPYRSLAVSPDGRTLAFPGWLNTVNVLDVASGDVVHSLSGHKHYSECAAFSTDGKVLATGGRDGTIRIWDLATGKELRTLDNPGTTTYLTYPPGGKTLVSTSWNERGKGECLLWDLEKGNVLRRWEDVGKPTVLSPDGKILVTGTADYQLRLWDVDTGKELAQFELPREKHAGRITPAEGARCATFSPDGKLLAAGDHTNRVHVWEVGTRKELYSSPPFKNWVTCLAFSPDSKKLAVGNWLRILLWEATTGKDLLPLGGHANQVGHVAFAPDGKTVMTQAEGALILWDPRTGRERQRWSDKTFVAFAPGGDTLLKEQDTLVQWQPATGKTLRTFQAYERPYPAYSSEVRVVFSRDGKTMVSGAQDRTIRLWDFETGKELWRAKRTNKDRRFPADIGSHWPLGFTHDDKAVISIGHDTVIRFWDVKTGKELRWFRTDADEVALSPDGRFLVGIGEHVADPAGKSETRGSAPPRMWDLTKGEPKPTELHPKAARAVTFSPDGSVVALALGSEIVLVERASGKELRRLKGHTDHVLDLAFSPDGRLLVSGSYDLTALVWDVADLNRAER